MTRNGVEQNADWNRLVKMFAQSGYRGYFALEYEEKEGAPHRRSPIHPGARQAGPAILRILTGALR